MRVMLFWFWFWFGIVDTSIGQVLKCCSPEIIANLISNSVSYLSILHEPKAKESSWKILLVGTTDSTALTTDGEVNSFSSLSSSRK